MRTHYRLLAAGLAAVFLPSTTWGGPLWGGAAVTYAALSAPPQRVLEGGHEGPLVAAVFTPDAAALMTAGQDGAVVRWNMADGTLAESVRLKLGPRASFPYYPAGAAFTPDGKRLVAAVRDGAVAAFDTATGVEQASSDFPDDLFPSSDVRVSVSADGKTALALFPTWLGNATGLGVVTAGFAADAPAHGKVFAGPGRQRWSSQSAAALTPDGSKAIVARVGRLARLTRCELTVVSAQDGATLTRSDFAFGNHSLAVAAAPDNRSAAVVGPDGQLVLWDLATGRPQVLFDVAPLGYTPPVFAADGRTIAVVTGSSYDGRIRYEDYRIRVLEVATGGVRYELNPGGYVNALAIAPDGSAVAAGMRDRTVTVWNLSPTGGAWPWPRCQSEPERLWSRIVAGTAAQAWPAMRELIARPDVAVRLIRDKVKAAPAPAVPNSQELAKLIQRLDAPAFADRMSAAADLRALGPRIRDELTAALQATQSTEVREQLERLLARLDTPPAAARVEARAVEVLERIGTPAAKDLLATFAAGSGHTALALDAQAALARLHKKTP
jgi:WD40 repeat protein